MLMCEDLSFFSCKWLVIQYIIRFYFCLSTSANNCRFPNKNMEFAAYKILDEVNSPGVLSANKEAPATLEEEKDSVRSS